MGQPIDTAEVLIVPDVSDFGRLLKAELDQAMRSVQSEVARAFGQVERSAAEAGARVGESFQAGGERAETSFRETSATARREFNEIEAQATKTSADVSAKLGGALALVKTALVGVGVAAAAGLGAITAFGLKSAASLEQTQIGMQALLGSADKTTAFIGELQKFSAETPFEFGDVSNAARRLLVLAQAMGQTEQAVVPMLTTIGDLVSVTGGTAESVESVVRALSQMSSKGKVSQEEIMQLAEALPGFNANAAIASGMGLSVADTLSKITAGGVDATTGINALLAGMAAFPGAAGAMAMQSKTLTGVFSTFKDTVGIALTEAFQPVIPEIKSTLGELTPVVGGALKELAPALGRTLSAILPLLGKVLQAIVPILVPILDALGPTLEALGPALVPLGEAIGQVLIALAPILPVLAQFIGVLAQVAIPVIQLLALVLKPLTPVLEFMAEALGQFGKALSMIDWAGVGRAIASWASGAWEAVSGFFTHWAKAIFDFGRLMGDVFKGILGFLWENFTETLKLIASLPGKAFQALKDIGSTLFESGKNLIRGLIDGIGSMGTALWNYVVDFAKRFVIDPIKGVFKIGSPSQLMADEVGEMIPAGIEQGVRAGASSLENLVGSVMPTGVGAPDSAGAAGMAFGGITINLNFYGGQPDEAAARSLASAAGDAFMGQVTRQRNIALAARTA